MIERNVTGTVSSMWWTLVSLSVDIRLLVGEEGKINKQVDDEKQREKKEMKKK
jgi:hypothetical protein